MPIYFQPNTFASRFGDVSCTWSDFETAQTMEDASIASGDEPTLPWFPLDDATEAAREFGHEEPTRAERPGARR